MTPTELKSLRVLVVGAGVTGLSVMRYCDQHSVDFDVADSKSIASDAVAALLCGGQYISGLESVVVNDYDVMILSPGIPRAHPMLAAAIDAGVQVIGDVELFAAVVVGDVIAITGSNGKSTVASMAAHVLECCGQSVELCGNIGTAVLDVLPRVQHTDVSKAPVYVLELSSYQLESMQRLSPLSATVLNVSDDHLDRYTSIDHYAAVKRSVYAQATHCIVNADDERTHPEDTAASVVSFSVTGLNSNFHLAETDGKTHLCIDGVAQLSADELGVPGLHNAANALAVMALLHPLDLEPKKLVEGLASFKGLEHRTEFVMEKRGVRWFNDSKGTNVDACLKAITAMPGPVVLIAGGQGKGVDFSPLRPVVTERVKALVLLGEDAPLMRAALDGAAELHDVDSMPAAVELANRIADSGDSVLQWSNWQHELNRFKNGHRSTRQP